MLTKPAIKKEFAKDWKKHDPDRVTCADSTCQSYDFINNTITKKKWDYIGMWKEFEKFFKKEGHASIPRYPVVDRWRPDLYFTIASIQDFQRIENGNMAFEYPANPLIVPQVCLRFPDIPNVGITGRHLTSFVMSGQHAFGYPKKSLYIQKMSGQCLIFLHSGHAWKHSQEGLSL